MTRRLLLVVLGLVAGALAAAPAGAYASAYSDAVAATPGAAAHWRLGEAGGTVAGDAVAGATGTASGVGFGAPGALTGDADTAARFSGSANVSVAARPTFTSAYSVETWARVDGLRVNGLVSDGTAAGGGSTSNGWFLSTAADGSLRFDAGTTGGLVTARSAPVATGDWHHVVATVDAAAVTLYVDGAAHATAPVTGTPRAATGASLRLGRASSGSSRSMRGWLDEVALYGAALDAATVSRHFALGADTRPPQTSVLSGPAGMATTPSAAFGFASAKAQVTYECRLDGNAWTACTSPQGLSGLADGAHAFAVRARDRYGIIEVAPRAYAWTVDTVPAATVALAVLPSAVTPDASVSFSSEPGARFECGGAGAWAPCASPVSAPAGGRLSIRAVDRAGNADPTPATLDVPAAPAATQPLSALTGPSAAFGFWSDGTARPDCSLDGAAWAPCGAALTTGPLVPGPHALAVRAAIPGGGVQAAQAVWTVTLPAPSLVGVQFPVVVYVPPAKKIGKAFPSSRLPAVRFSLNVGASVRLALDRTSGAARGRHIRTWTVPGRAGANVSRLPLAVYRRLGAARYRLTANASGAAGASVARAVRFQVVRKRTGR